MIKQALFAAAALALLHASLPAQAQAWPNRPIRLVVPYAAGGPTDVVARQLAKKIGSDLGQAVTVENKAGAGGVIGVDAVVKAAPDGYTFALAAPGPLAGMPSLTKVPYTQNDVQYISLVARIPSVIVVNKNSGLNTLGDLIKRAKAEPGKLNYSSAGAGTTPHIGAELLKQEAEIDLTHVPYKGAAPALTALLAGEVQMAMVDLLPVMPHVQSGALRILAIAGTSRAPQVPDVPTTRELGLPKVLMDTNYGFIAPVGLPPEVLAKFREAVAAAVQSPEIKEQFLKQGAIALSSTPDEYRSLMRAEFDKWSMVVKKGRITLE
jgi:tripartite-type tricarboxylate transporter receptor subunit TctC